MSTTLACNTPTVFSGTATAKSDIQTDQNAAFQQAWDRINKAAHYEANQMTHCPETCGRKIISIDKTQIVNVEYKVNSATELILDILSLFTKSPHWHWRCDISITWEATVVCV